MVALDNDRIDFIDGAAVMFAGMSIGKNADELTKSKFIDNLVDFLCQYENMFLPFEVMSKPYKLEFVNTLFTKYMKITLDVTDGAFVFTGFKYVSGFLFYVIEEYDFIYRILSSEYGIGNKSVVLNIDEVSLDFDVAVNTVKKHGNILSLRLNKKED
jgi:hypothetical protein